MTGTIRRRGPTNMSTLLATVKGEAINLQHQQLRELESIYPLSLTVLLLAEQRLHRSTDGGDTFTTLAPKCVTAFLVLPKGPRPMALLLAARS